MARTRVLLHAMLLTVPVLAAVAGAPSVGANITGAQTYECHLTDLSDCPPPVVQAGTTLSIHYHPPGTVPRHVELFDVTANTVVMGGCATPTTSGRAPGVTPATYTFLPNHAYLLSWGPDTSCSGSLMVGPNAPTGALPILALRGMDIQPPGPCVRPLNGHAITTATAARPALGDRECVGGDPWEPCNGHSSEWGDPNGGSTTRRYTNACTTGDPHVCHGEGTTHQEYRQDPQTGAYSSRTTGSYSETCGGDGGDCYGVWQEQGRLEQTENGKVRKVPTDRQWVTQVCPTLVDPR